MIVNVWCLLYGYFKCVYDGYCKLSEVEVHALLFVFGRCGRNGG